MAITSEQIITASIDILNRNGIQGLTMRTLANELNIKAASLYWHIKDKKELYDLISEAISSEIDFSVFDGNPKSDLIKIHAIWRELLLKIRDSTEIFAQSFPTTENRLKAIGVLLDKLLAYGVKEEYVLTAANLLNNYVLSFVADETRSTDMIKSAASTGSIEMFMGRFPAPLNFDQQFLYGLEVILAGLKEV